MALDDLAPPPAADVTLEALGSGIPFADLAEEALDDLPDGPSPVVPFAALALALILWDLAPGGAPSASLAALASAPPCPALDDLGWNTVKKGESGLDEKTGC